MTSEELKAIRQRFEKLVGDGPVVKWGETWMNVSVNLIPILKDVDALMMEVEKLQGDVDHRDKIIHDLTEESSAYQLGVKEGRREIFELLHDEPLWATSGIRGKILDKYKTLIDPNRIPPSLHQEECERLLTENERLKAEIRQNDEFLEEYQRRRHPGDLFVRGLHGEREWVRLPEEAADTPPAASWSNSSATILEDLE